MKSLKVGEGTAQTTYICAHWRAFPPAGAGQDKETLRSSEILDHAQYSRLGLWERDCGLMEMAESKCLTCPHRRRVEWETRGPVLVSPDGTRTPVVDPAAGEAAPRNRHLANIFQRPGTRGSSENAAWTKNHGGGEGDGSDG